MFMVPKTWYNGTMTVKVTNTGVTNSQPPEETTDRSVSSRGSFNDKKIERNKIVLFGLFGIVIIGIVIALVFFLKPNSGDVINDDNAETDAFYVAKKIDGLYVADENYTLDDAVNDYERQLAVGDDEYKVSIGIYYARFVLKNTKDLEKAVGIMKRVEPLIGDNKTLTVDYYSVLRGFYRGVDDELYNYYDGLIINLVKVEDIKEGSANE